MSLLFAGWYCYQSGYPLRALVPTALLFFFVLLLSTILSAAFAHGTLPARCSLLLSTAEWRVRCVPDGTYLRVVDVGSATPGQSWSIPLASPATDIDLAPDGSRVYVSNGKDSTVSVIRTADNQIEATVPVGKRPWNMALTPDGRKLYVANGKSNNVSVIDTTRLENIAEIPVGELPWGVVIR